MFKILKIVLMHDEVFQCVVPVRYRDRFESIGDFKTRACVQCVVAGIIPRDSRIAAFNYHAINLVDSACLDTYIPELETNIPRFQLYTYTPGHHEIYVKNLRGKLLVFMVNENDSTLQVMRMIQGQEQLPIFEQRLIYSGKQLQWDKTLSEYGIPSCAILNLCLRMRGGGPPPSSFVDVSNSSQLKTVAFSTDAPKWRVAVRGLNIEGICCNSSCAAHGQLVICGKGLTYVDLQDCRANCPICRAPVTPLTCGFTGCKWKFEGRKASGITYASDWTTASATAYDRFDETSGSIEWSRLVLTASADPTVDCAICMMPIEMSEIPALPCKHQYHLHCIESWRNQQQTCPTCRADLSGIGQLS